jgi:hypothetical protein
MKKFQLIFFVAIAAITLSSFIHVNDDTDPGKQIVNGFKKNFPLADNVRWIAGKNLHIAAFTYNEKQQLAYYSYEGVYIGQSWRVNFYELTENIRKSILNGANEADVKSVLLFLPNDGHLKFIATLETNGKQIKREVYPNGDSFIVKKTRIPTSGL